MQKMWQQCNSSLCSFHTSVSVFLFHTLPLWVYNYRYCKLLYIRNRVTKYSLVVNVQRYSNSYYSYTLQPYICSVSKANCHEIKDSKDLHKALAEIGNWEALCANLRVEKAVLDGLRYSLLQHEEKKQRCLQAFYQQGTICWETVINVLTEYPFYNRRLANWIAKEYGAEQPDEERPEKRKLFLPCLSVCLSVCWPIYLSIYLSTNLSVCLLAYLSIYQSVCLSAGLSIYLPICLSVCLLSYLSICLSVCLLTYLLILLHDRVSLHKKSYAPDLIKTGIALYLSL